MFSGILNITRKGKWEGVKIKEKAKHCALKQNLGEDIPLHDVKDHICLLKP